MVFYEIQQALGSGFGTPTRIRQESSFKYKHATVFFISSSFSGVNTTPKTWIFRVHSRIYPLLQWNILSFEDSCQKSHVKMTAWLGLFPSFYFFPPPLAFFFFLSFPFLPILSMSSADPLPLVTDPQRQSALFCLSAIVYRHKNTNGQQLKAINSFEVDPLCAWHQPPWLLSPNTSRSIAAVTPTFSTQNLPGIILKATGL